MPEILWREGPETVDVCVEDMVDLQRPSGPPVAVLLGILAEGIALLATGLWVLVAG